MKVKREGTTHARRPASATTAAGSRWCSPSRARSRWQKVADDGHDHTSSATSARKGPGNLRGVRHLFDARAARARSTTSSRSTAPGSASRAAPSAATATRVTYKGPGGHSYGAFGMPNPIHALGRAIAAIADIQVPTTPKTTFNVGIIEGGTSVNSISLERRRWSRHALGVAAGARRRSTRSSRRPFADALAAENARWPASRVRDLRSRSTRSASARPARSPTTRRSSATAHRRRARRSASRAPTTRVEHRREHADEPRHPGDHDRRRRRRPGRALDVRVVR